FHGRTSIRWHNLHPSYRRNRYLLRIRDDPTLGLPRVSRKRTAPACNAGQAYLSHPVSSLGIMRFAHLKRILRLGRLRLRGPRGAQDEFVLAAIAQNLRPLATLVARPPPFPAQCIV